MFTQLTFGAQLPMLRALPCVMAGLLSCKCTLWLKLLLLVVVSVVVCKSKCLRMTHGSARAHAIVIVCDIYLWQDIADSLTGVSWRFDKRRDASPSMIGRFGGSEMGQTHLGPRPTINVHSRWSAKIFLGACSTQGVLVMGDVWVDQEMLWSLVSWKLHQRQNSEATNDRMNHPHYCAKVHIVSFYLFVRFFQHLNAR